MTAQQVYDEVTRYLSTHFGADYITNWYVGITNDIDERLFGAHQVNRQSKGWVWRRAIDSNHARAAEAMLLKRGHDGGASGGDYTTVFVYAFRKDPGTVR